MRKYSPLYKKYIKYCWISLVLVSVSVLAEGPAPSQDFWEYMNDFDDGSGDVLDPLEYDQLSNSKNDAVADATENDVHESDVHESDESSEQKYDVDIKHSDMKLKTRSSAQSSSLMMKGATP